MGGEVTRVDWDTYFMSIARFVAARATCDRKHVGCVLVSTTHSILATGYNGSVRGAPHCDDVGHDMLDGHCVRTVHAEMNAVAQAACRGTPISGAVAYVTTFPCYACFKVLVNAGVFRIVWEGEYGHTAHEERVRAAAVELDIQLAHYEGR